MSTDDHPLRFYWNVLKASGARFADEDVPTRSAALAFYMVFSLPPMLLIILWTAGRVYREAAVREAVFAEIGAMVGEEGARQLMATIEGLDIQEPTWWATAAAVGAMLVTASTVLVTTQSALNRIFEVEPADTAGMGVWRMLRGRLVSFAMLVTVSFLLTVSLVVDALITAVDLFLARWIGGLSNLLMVVDSMLLDLAAMTVLFALLFRYLPDLRLEWRDIWFGALMTACWFMLGEYLIGFLIGSSEAADLYDAAGSVLVLMLWVYYASAIFLFGATFTATRAGLQRRNGRTVAIRRREANHFEPGQRPPKEEVSRCHGPRSEAESRKP
jgi:membrane protein